MTQAGKVAEIFSIAGEAFTKLGQLAMTLQPMTDKSQDGGKWGPEEVVLLKSAVSQFGDSLEKISASIKSKSVSQIKTALRQKAVQNLTVPSMNGAGLSVSPLISTVDVKPILVQSTPEPAFPAASRLPTQKSASAKKSTPIMTQQSGFEPAAKRPKVGITTTSLLASPVQNSSALLGLQNYTAGTVSVIGGLGAASGGLNRTGNIRLASSQGFQHTSPGNVSIVQQISSVPGTSAEYGIIAPVQMIQATDGSGNVDVEG